MNTAPDLLATALQMLVALAVMGGLLVLVLWISRRMQQYRFSGSAPNVMRVLETRHLAVKKSVTLLEIPGAVLVIGISDNEMCLLDKISDTQLVQEVTAACTTPAALTSFSDQLQKILLRRKGRE